MLLIKISFLSLALSHDYGCDTLLNRFHDQSESSYCKTLLQNLSVCCNGCGWLQVGCSGVKRSADRPPGFQCPQYLLKATHADRSIPTTALSTDLYTQNQDHTTTLPPREAQVADDANNGAIVAAAHHNVAEKNENICETFWHTLPGNADKIDRIHKKICQTS